MGRVRRGQVAAEILATESAPPEVVAAVRDARNLPPAEQDYRIGLEAGIAGLKIGFSPDLGYAVVDPEVATAVAAAVETLADLGAKVEEVEPPFERPLETFHVHWFAGAARRMAQIPEDKRSLTDSGFQEIAEIGHGYSLAQYQQAVAHREDLMRAMRAFHERYDLLVTPTTALTAFEAGLEVPAESGLGRWTEWASFSYPFNLTQQPACSVPCGLTAAGLPVGLQIVGPRYDDALVLRAARAFESSRPFQAPPAPSQP